MYNLCTKIFIANLINCPAKLPKVNKRLDEWVTADRLDMKKLQFPKKEAKTPTKNGLPGSRPSSPEREVVSMFCLQQTRKYCTHTIGV